MGFPERGLGPGDRCASLAARNGEAEMRVAIIGGSGHVGTYLVPRLVAAGHEVINVARGTRSAYQPNAAWQRVNSVTIDL